MVGVPIDRLCCSQPLSCSFGWDKGRWLIRDTYIFWFRCKLRGSDTNITFWFRELAVLEYRISTSLFSIFLFSKQPIYPTVILFEQGFRALASLKSKLLVCRTI
jgi:hypothetical protein